MADEELRILFAKRLNHFLELNGYNQADLARHMKVSTATTAKWCTGQTMPRIDKIQSICNWLGIEKSDLLEDKTDDGYHLNADARDLVQFLYDNPEYKSVFDAVRKVKKDDIQFINDFIKRVAGND